MAGISVHKGMGLRIPSFTIAINEQGEVTSSVTVEIALDMWPMWLDVSVASARSSAAARSELELAIAQAGEDPLGGEDQAKLLAAECMPSMVGIAASAFALENFATVIKRFAPDIERVEEAWRRARTPMHKRVSETLRRTFNLSNAAAQRQRKSIADIFRFRNWAVHPPVGFRAPVPHDLLPTATEWRFAAFRASNAIIAATSAVGMIGECIGNSPARRPELVKWCKSREGEIQQRSTRVQDELDDAIPTSQETADSSDDPDR